MFEHSIDPVLFHIGALEIRYYGIIYALGFLLAYLVLKKNTKDLKLSEKDIDNFVLYLVLGVIIGARLFYILFYNLTFFMQNPGEILQVWHGGLSFHGGLVGGSLVAVLFCKRKNIGILKLADIMTVPLAMALFLGRIANFINGELYGRKTTLPWGVKFKNVEGFRHPSQLYEAVKNLVLLGLAAMLRKKTLPDGTIFGTFLLGYGVVRFVIEFFREPEVYVWILTMGQFLSVLTALAGAILTVQVWKKSGQKGL